MWWWATTTTGISARRGTGRSGLSRLCRRRLVELPVRRLFRWTRADFVFIDSRVHGRRLRLGWRRPRAARCRVRRPLERDSWTLQTLPMPKGRTVTVSGVSSPSRNYCTVVGRIPPPIPQSLSPSARRKAPRPSAGALSEPYVAQLNGHESSIKSCLLEWPAPGAAPDIEHVPRSLAFPAPLSTVVSRSAPGEWTTRTRPSATERQGPSIPSSNAGPGRPGPMSDRAAMSSDPSNRLVRFGDHLHGR